MCNPGSTTAGSFTVGHTAEPVDAVIDRLNDPAVAAALVTVLDHAELLSSLVVELAAFMERGHDAPPGRAIGADPAMGDPEARKGMELLVEAARAIGRRMP